MYGSAHVHAWMLVCLSRVHREAMAKQETELFFVDLLWQDKAAVTGFRVVTEKECLSPFTKQSVEGFYSHTHVNISDHW